MNILVTDIVFPNKYGVWRNLEINSFIEHYSADVLVKHVSGYAGINLNIDYDFVNSNNILHDYEFLIFDSAYNFLNRYNNKVDGTMFNGLSSFSYLITKKGNFDLHSYDLVYHIFYMMYNSFNNEFVFPFRKQVVHLYPGGGYDGVQLNVHPDVNLISSSPITTNHISYLPNNYIDCWIGPFMLQGEHIPTRDEHTNKEVLTVCFASIGSGFAKGDQHYIELVELFQDLYPNDKVRFISIGNCASHGSIVNYPTMDYQALGLFYQSEVDIYVNLETGRLFNGWPLGLEAGKAGCVLLTTDSYNQRAHYGIDDDTIPVCHSVSEFVDFIHILVCDRVRMNSIKRNFRVFITQYISYEMQQQRVFDFLNQVSNRNLGVQSIALKKGESRYQSVDRPLTRIPIINNTIISLTKEQNDFRKVKNEQIAELKQKIVNLKEEIESKSRRELAFSDRVHELTNVIADYENQIMAKNAHIEMLEKLVQQYEQRIEMRTNHRDDVGGYLQNFLIRLQNIFKRN